MGVQSVFSRGFQRICPLQNQTLDTKQRGDRSEDKYDEMLSFLLWRNKCSVDFPSLNINNGNCSVAFYVTQITAAP